MTNFADELVAAAAEVPDRPALLHHPEQPLRHPGSRPAGTRVIWMSDQLPKGPTGKILTREIEVPVVARTQTR